MALVATDDLGLVGESLERVHAFDLAIAIGSRVGPPGGELEHKWMTEFKPYFGPVRLPKRKLVQVKQHALLDLNKIKYEKQITMNPTEKRDQLR